MIGKREIISIEEYLSISARLNYQLNSPNIERGALLSLILGEERFHEFKTPLEKTIDFLITAYGGMKRAIGSPAILHPLRTAALIGRAMDQPTLLDLLGSLLHDKGEDIIEKNLTEERKKEVEELFEKLQQSISKDEKWFLGERIAFLTRKDNCNYIDYTYQILEKVHQMPDLLHIKLADRLDNTLDTNLQHPQIANFFRTVFDILFVQDFKGLQFAGYHFMPSDENCALVLSQLFKNAIFMSILRKESLDQLDDTTKRLFNALAVAGMQEGQWIAQEIISKEITDVKKQRKILLETMDYCIKGGITRITKKECGGVLDGMFVEKYSLTDGKARRRNIQELVKDKALLFSLIVAFISIFSSFLNVPKFYIKGIDKGGFSPV